MAQKITLLLFFILAALPCLAQSLPTEVSLLLRDLHQPPHTEKQKEQLEEWVKRANSELSEINKLDFFITSKALIYKFYIQLAKDNAHIRFKGSLGDALNYLKTVDVEKGSALTKWLAASLKNELEQFLASPEYENRNKTPISPSSRSKLNYISTLTALLKQSGAEEFSGRVQPKLFKLAEQLFNYNLYFLHFTRSSDNQQKLGKLFKAPNETKEGPTLDQLLAPALKKEQTADGSLSDSDWVPKDITSLPRPVDDWADDNDFTIRYVVPNYTPPGKLPEPVDDWEEVAEKEWEKVQLVAPTQDKKLENSDPEDDWVLR